MQPDEQADPVNPGSRWHLDAARARELLALLDARLRTRGVAASV